MAVPAGTLATVTDTGAPIEPEGFRLITEVATAAAAGDRTKLERLVEPESARDQRALLRSPGVLNGLDRILTTRPSVSDGYREGYFYPGFAARPHDALNALHIEDLQGLGVVVRGPAAGKCNGYEGVTTSFEKRTSGGNVRYVWVGVSRC
jgi:hypothetical protein